jgi:hypothetical protein
MSSEKQTRTGRSKQFSRPNIVSKLELIGVAPLCLSSAASADVERPCYAALSFRNLLMNQKEGKNIVMRTLGFGLIGVLMATAAWGQLMITGSTTLDRDVPEGIVIAANGITLDCASHRVSGGSRPAIEVTGRRDVIVRRCFVSNSFRGFFIRDIRRSTFERNSVSTTMLKGFVSKDLKAIYSSEMLS